MASHVSGMEKGDALVIVDVQKDFCPGGALPIENGDKVVPVLNQWIREAEELQIPVYASRDWHPVAHISFKEQGGPWPPHCIQDTDGAGYHSGLKLPDSVIKITKGNRFDHDQNSAFDDTGLTQELRRKDIRRIWVGGLAMDVCVRATVMDGIKEGFLVMLIEDATLPVTKASGEQARNEMKAAGVYFVKTQ